LQLWVTVDRFVNAPLHGDDDDDDDDVISSSLFFESICLWHCPKAECDPIRDDFRLFFRSRVRENRCEDCSCQ
jgi:hypothetical protein